MSDAPDNQVAIYAAWPTVMEMESQPQMQWLLNRQLFMSIYEKTVYGLEGDDQKLLAEFANCSGFTYTFNELRDQLYGDANSVLM